VVVLGPTRELTDQIFRVCKALSHSAKFRAGLFNASVPRAKQRQMLERPLDVVVATTKAFADHLAGARVYIGDCKYVVLDEADTMFDRGFGPEVTAILGPMKKKPAPANAVLVSATMTRKVKALIQEQIPGAATVATDTLHRGVAGSQHEFLSVPPGGDKLRELDKLVGRNQGRVMVFCNTQGSCRAVDHYLGESGVRRVCYHGEMPREARTEALEGFMSPSGPDVMVCTDLAARGLDIPGRVDLVVNFDFPLNPIDYLHRTGRTARAGASGRVVSVVAKRDRVLAARIEQGLRRGEALDELSADRSVLPESMRPKPETLARRREQEIQKRGKGLRGAARMEALRERRKDYREERDRKIKSRSKGRARAAEAAKGNPTAMGGRGRGKGRAGGRGGRGGGGRGRGP